MTMDTLVAEVAAQASLQTSIDTLLSGVASRMKAISNDQNIQRLARELVAAAPALGQAVAAPPQARL